MRILTPSKQTLLHLPRAYLGDINCGRQFSLSNSNNSGVGEQILKEFHSYWKAGKAPEKFNFSRDVFDRHAKHRPSATALFFDNDANEERKWSFSELQKESIRSGIFLRSLLDLKDGSKTSPYVLTVLSRIPEWWFLHLAAIRIGTVFSPGTTMLTSKDIEFRLDASRAKMIITDEANMGKIDEASKGMNFGLKKVVVRSGQSKASLKPDWIDFHSLIGGISEQEVANFKNSDTLSGQLAQGYFTSGTTGFPKMVAHSHASYGIGHYTTAKGLNLKDTDLLWNISDPGWAKSSYSNLFAPWIAGSAVYIHQMERFEARKVLQVLTKQPITTFCAPPTLYKAMVQERDPNLFKAKALRYCIGGGEPVSSETAKVWKNKTGIQLNELYGQTEMTAVDCEDSSAKQGSVGIPKGFLELGVVDDEGKELPPGEEGNVGLKVKPIRPLGLFKGYLRKGPNGPEMDVEKNDSVFVGDYYITGDRAYKDESGYLFLAGRADDVIGSAGYRIGPTEIESVLQTHPSVVESAVVASPDPDRVEVVKAFIILTPEYKKKLEEPQGTEKLVKEIQNYVKEQTAPYKYPRKVEFVEALPKTVSGKILRRELKRMEYEKYKNKS